MTDTKCNGWTNAATWTVNLWFGDHWHDRLNDGETIDADAMREEIEEYIEALMGEKPNGFIRDMFDLGSVNWYELASHYKREPEA